MNFHVFTFSFSDGDEDNEWCLELRRTKVTWPQLVCFPLGFQLIVHVQLTQLVNCSDKKRSRLMTRSSVLFSLHLTALLNCSYLDHCERYTHAKVKY